MEKTTLNVAILVFEKVEPLDFCGPLEVFAATRTAGQPDPFHVFTCAEDTQPIWARGVLSVNPQFPVRNCPVPDILVLPGGWGVRELLGNAPMLDWIKEAAVRCKAVLSVCTGSLLLAKTGLLDGLSATTHHDAIDLLKLLAPQTTIRRWDRFVDNGQIIVAAGVSAGIDAALHLVAKLLGVETAQATAEYMEYPWRPARDLVPSISSNTSSST